MSEGKGIRSSFEEEEMERASTSLTHKNVLPTLQHPLGDIVAQPRQQNFAFFSSTSTAPSTPQIIFHLAAIIPHSPINGLLLVPQ